ncbi:NMDA receptor synaptonuclear signaling and neuronal migration factor-like [Asterias rubens]|uniref:NMDA receptor synaptonuclear signaling and neuronal migration factor-like n=1 Tax=Asterias rubens TaxID=7604 RepID=UPI001455A5CC|nr:NMDA receptor synaptonuclear signaling and neuronal migration factor-like [Asterias rubens]
MGSGSSKKKQETARKVTNAVNVANAFQDAGKRSEEKRSLQTAGDRQDEEKGVNNGEVVHQEISNEKEKQPLEQNGDASHVVVPDPPIENGVNDDDANADELMLSHASVKIQSVFRGYQERALRRKETEMAIKIQRIYRRHSSQKKEVTEAAVMETIAEVTPVPEEAPAIEGPAQDNCEPDPCKATKEWLEKTPTKTNVKKQIVGVGQQTKEDFIAFQDEITELKWYAEQQLEKAICGSEFVGPRIVLVSSKVPKGDLLTKVVKDNVLIFHYDFNKDTFDNLLENIQVNLEAFKPGSKARSICIYCQGGPGFLYIRRGKVVTVAKLKKEREQDQVRFFKEMGKLMSKREPAKSFIHVMGCNMLGNEKGEQLFTHLQGIMKPNIVRFEAPLELSPAGVEMIETYFDFEKYKTWRSNKHLKLDLDL